jgi:hypothetical protein
MKTIVFVSLGGYHLLLYSALGFAGAVLLALVVLAEVRSRTSIAVPTAELTPGARARRHALPRWLGMLGMLVGLGSAWWLFRHSTDVVTVTDGAGDPVVTRQIYLGARDHFAERAPGAHCYRNPTWVLNEASRPVTLQQIGYWHGHTFQPLQLQPHAAACPDTVDFVGPSDVPPAEIAPDMPKIENRVWLTWDPVR